VRKDTNFFVPLQHKNEKQTIMSETIRFSVHRNPKQDPKAPDTYHVRHKTLQTVGREFIEHQLTDHRKLDKTEVKGVLDNLPAIIVENLLDNRSVNIKGLGSFSLRLGFRPQGDEDNPVKPQFTDPAQITGNHVQIEGITFKPDKEFLNLLYQQGHHFENATGRGQVGHSNDLTEAQVRQFLKDYLSEHGHITRRLLQFYLHLTEYTATKWLDKLTAGPSPLLVGEKIGNAFAYSLRKK
jgi:nucleoid DNA-binding protein